MGAQQNSVQIGTPQQIAVDRAESGTVTFNLCSDGSGNVKRISDTATVYFGKQFRCTPAFTVSIAKEVEGTTNFQDGEQGALNSACCSANNVTSEKADISAWVYIDDRALSQQVSTKNTVEVAWVALGI